MVQYKHVNIYTNLFTRLTRKTQ